MSLEQDVTLLQDVPTFDMLTPDALRTLAISADQLRLAAGDILFREGDLADAGYVLTSGRLEMVEEQGARPRVLCEVLPGALVGESALLIALPRPATARALEASTLLRIPRATFLRVLEGFPEAAVQLRAVFAGRLEATLGALDTLRREKLEPPVRPPVRRR